MYLGCVYIWLILLLLYCALRAHVRCNRLTKTLFTLHYASMLIIVCCMRSSSGPPSPQLPPCWTRPPRESWELPSQRGWLKAGAWYPDTCAIHNLNMDALRRCLRNTSLLLQGDSNMRMMFVMLASILGSDATNTHWHAPIFLQVTLYWGQACNTG